MEEKDREQLLEFIRANRAGGVSDADMRAVLKEKGGWTDEDIDPVFRLAGEEGGESESAPETARDILLEERARENASGEKMAEADELPREPVEPGQQQTAEEKLMWGKREERPYSPAERPPLSEAAEPQASTSTPAPSSLQAAQPLQQPEPPRPEGTRVPQAASAGSAQLASAGSAQAASAWQTIATASTNESVPQEAKSEPPGGERFASEKNPPESIPPEDIKAKEGKEKTASARKARSMILAVIAVLVLLSVGGGVVYAYFQGINPLEKVRTLFAKPPYTEENFLSGLLASASAIRSLTYAFSGSFAMEPRDPDAEPFVLPETEDGEARRILYQNDMERVGNVYEVLAELKFAETYPADFNELARLRSTDGGNAEEEGFGYRLVEGGEDFELIVTFETPEAVSAIRKTSGLTQENTKIDGTTITFSKESPSYFYHFSHYFPPESTQLSFVRLGEFTEMLPPEMSADILLEATANTAAGSELADFELSFDAEGDFGDLAYKIAADARKKEDDFYIRVRNMPSIMGSQFSALKGTWIHIPPPEPDEEFEYGYFSGLRDRFPARGEEYKAMQKDATALLKSAAMIADKEKLFFFKSEPERAKLGGQTVYRYDLGINKEAVVPFMEQVLREAERYENISRDETALLDQGFLDDLKSEHFQYIFDYYAKNTAFVLWADTNGNPVLQEYSIRIVPPDTATALRDRQGRAVFKLALKDINKPVVVEAPSSARTLEEVFEEFTTSSAFGQSGVTSRDTKRVSDIAQMRIALELYFDDKGAYPGDIETLVKDGYLPLLPKDPTGGGYAYAALGAGKCTSYHLGTVLEGAKGTENVITIDADAAPSAACIASAASDFHGTAAGCIGIDGAEPDGCYDVTPDVP